MKRNMRGSYIYLLYGKNSLFYEPLHKHIIHKQVHIQTLCIRPFLKEEKMILIDPPANLDAMGTYLLMPKNGMYFFHVSLRACPTLPGVDQHRNCRANLSDT